MQQNAVNETETRAIGTVKPEVLDEVLELLTGLSARGRELFKLHTVVLKSESGPPRELSLQQHLPLASGADGQPQQRYLGYAWHSRNSFDLWSEV